MTAVAARRFDLAGLLRRGVRRARGRPPSSFVMTHVHVRPRVIARTDAGDIDLTLMGTCLYEDAFVLLFVTQIPEPVVVSSFICRFGDEEETEDAEMMPAVDAIRFQWALSWKAEEPDTAEAG